MITKISVENIKSFKEIGTIDISPFTLLIGDNGSGKSTFIQILSLFSQNPSALSLENGQFVSQGGFEQLVNNEEKPIKIKIQGKISIDAEGYNYLNDLTYTLDVEYEKSNQNNIQRVKWKIESLDPQNFLLNELKRKNKVFLESSWDRNTTEKDLFWEFFDEIEKQIFKINIQKPRPMNFSVRRWLPSEYMGEEQKIRFLALMANLSTKLRSELEKISYIPALRGLDTSFQNLVDQIPNHPLDSLNFNHQSSLLASSLAYNRDLEDRISGLIEAVLKRKCRSRLQQGILVSVETYNGEKWVNIMNEGFGANPLVQLVYQIVAAPKNSLVLIEEPEIHLFPAAQKRLVTELIKFAKNDNKHILFTTHSSHIYSVISRLKEQHEKEATIYFFNRDDQNKSSTVEEITSANRTGILKEFLSTDVGEIAETLDAAGT